MQLPATSWLERWDLASWHLLFQSHPLVQYSPPMRLPPGETRTETEILAAISVAMGKPLFGSRWLANLWGKPGWNRFMPALLDGLFWLWRRHWQGARGIPWFRPRTGQYKRKVCFWHERLEPERERLARFATQTANFSEKSDVSDRFILLGRRRRRGQNSWLHGGVHGGKAEAFAWLCPEDMARLGLAKGEKVWLGTAVGELTLPIHPQPGIPPGIVVVPHGLPGSNVNRIISSDQVEPVSGMHRLQGMPVTVRKVS
jgi:anaerobic selenocysteine-containing dehydrogenase